VLRTVGMYCNLEKGFVIVTNTGAVMKQQKA